MARDRSALGREGLLTEGTLSLLNAEFNVARSAGALLAHLLALEVVAPLSSRSVRPPVSIPRPLR